VRSRYKVYNNEAAYFITSTIVDWVPIFTSEKYYDVITEAFRYSQSKKNLKLYAYVFLDNHFHIIASGENLSDVMKSVKSFSAKLIIKNLTSDNKYEILKKLKNNKANYKTKSVYQVWQEGFHPKEIISDNMFQQKIDYIHFNPVRRNHVREPQDWKYSSAEYYYEGKEGVLKLNGLE
jgi:putative transposase